MIESFFEQNVTDANEASKKKRQAVLRVFSIISLVMGILLIFMAYMMFMGGQVPEDASIWLALIPIFIDLFFAAVFIFFYFWIKRAKNHTLLEYDYTFVSGSLRIAKVINHLKRKPLIAIECSDIEAMDKVSEESFLRYDTMKGIKKVVATPNTESEDLYYIFCKKGGENTLLIVEPQPELVVMIRRSARMLRRK